MKQPETPKSAKPTSHATTTPPSRLRVNGNKQTDSPRAEEEPCNDSLAKGKSKSASPNAKIEPAKNRRSLVLKRAKSAEEDAAGSQKPRPSSRPTARRPVYRKAEEEAEERKRKAEERKRNVEELEEKLELSESLVRDLELQVVRLKMELEKAVRLNSELESKNKKLSQDLSEAEAKMASLTITDKKEAAGEYQSSKFKDIQKLIASKLEQPKIRKEAILEPSPVNTRSPSPPLPTPSKLSATPSLPPPPPPKWSVPQVSNENVKVSAVSSTTQETLPSPPAPPPPPPPPPPRPPARGPSAPKAPPIVQFYHSLKKQEVKRDTPTLGTHNKLAASSVHSSIVGEIQNRSAHLLAIKADIETKGEFINDLIRRVQAAAYPSIEDVVNFVDWLDIQLASLADERAVLKHFNWPERKADAMREAAVEYRELRKLEGELSSHVDDLSIPCGVALKKMASLLDKSERSIQKLVKLRSSVMRSYQDLRIPVDWMLDSGMMSKIKRASMKLAKSYMERVMMELELAHNIDRESTQEALILQGVHFAYRTHQFAGGLDSETLCAFEEIKQRVPGRLCASQELMAGIPSS